MKIDLPRGLEEIAQTTFLTWNHDAETIAKELTLFSYCSAFSSAEQKFKCLSVMKSCGPGTARTLAHQALGIPQAMNRYARELKYCPVCRKEDLERFGETYWRRAQQLEGSVVCLEHDSLLAASRAYFRRPGGRTIMNDATLCTSDTTPQPPQDFTANELAILRDVSRRCKQLLAGTETAWGNNVDELIDKYRRHAIDTGIRFRGNQISTSSLLGLFSEFFGKRILEAVHCQLKSNDSWLAPLFRTTKSYAIHPLYHLLVQVFLEHRRPELKALHPLLRRSWKCPSRFGVHPDEYSIETVSVRSDPSSGEPVASAKCSCGFYFTFRKAIPSDSRMPDVSKVTRYGSAWVAEGHKLIQSGLSMAAAASVLGSSLSFMQELSKKYVPTTTSSTIRQWRREWQRAVKETPNLTLQLMAKRHPAPYKALRRYDRDWLLSEQRNSRRKFYQQLRKPQTNWGERDKAWAGKLEAAIARAKACPSLRPMSRTQLALQAGISPLTLRVKQSLLPLCNALIRTI
jgi:hypothetical protein